MWAWHCFAGAAHQGNRQAPHDVPRILARAAQSSSFGATAVLGDGSRCVHAVHSGCTVMIIKETSVPELTTTTWCSGVPSELGPRERPLQELYLCGAGKRSACSLQGHGCAHETRHPAVGGSIRVVSTSQAQGHATLARALMHSAPPPLRAHSGGSAHKARLGMRCAVSVLGVRQC